MQRGTRTRLRGCATFAVAVLATLLLAPPAGASMVQPRIVSEMPAANTPHAVNDSTVANAAVQTFTQVGGVMYAGGTFHTVQNPARTTSYVRQNLFSFSVSTGNPTAWAPQVNGTVLRTLAVGGYLYVGGSFTTADGVPGYLVRYSLSSLRVDPTWHPAGIDGRVSDLELVGSRLFVSGAFTKRLVALNPATGADTGYLNVSVAGTVAANAGPTQVYRFAVNPSHTRLLGIGNFTAVGGYSRTRAVMLDLGSTGTVDRWYYPPLTKMCGRTNMPAYLRDVDFSPDGSYFVIVSSGFFSLPGDSVLHAL